MAEDQDKNHGAHEKPPAEPVPVEQQRLLMPTLPTYAALPPLERKSSRDEDEEESGGGMSVGLALQSIRQWWLVTTPVGLALAVAVAALVWFTFVPTYEAVGYLKIEPKQPVVPSRERDRGEPDLDAATEVETILSPIVLDRVVENSEVASLPEILAEETPVRMLAKEIKIESKEATRLFTIRLSLPEADSAATIIRQVLAQYVAYRENQELEGNRRIKETLDLEIQRKEQDLQARRAELKALAESVGETLSTLEERVVLLQAGPISEWTRQRNQSAVQLEEMKARAAVYQGQLDRLASGQEDAALDAEVVRRIEQSAELLEAQRRLQYAQMLLDDWIEKTPGLKPPERLTAPVRNYEEELQALRKRLEDRVRRQLNFDRRNELQARIAECQALINFHQKLIEHFDKEIEEERAKLEEQRGKRMKLEFALADLRSDEDMLRQLKDSLRYLLLPSGPSRFTVYPPKTPKAPEERYPIRKIVATSLGAFILPFVLAFLWEFRVQRVTAGRQVAEGARVPLIAEVPGMPVQPRLMSIRSASGFRRHRAMLRDSIHYLCRCILLPDSTRHLQVLAVTSAISGEGKTSLSYLLASSIGMYSGERVLLIDGDLRRPDIHEFLELPENVGLSELLANGSGENGFERYVRPHEECLEILPAGHPKEHPHVLLGRGKFETLLSRLREHYRYIVIDTPPMLTSGEALSLCRAADGVLLCVMRDLSRQSQVQTAYHRLLLAGAHPIGAVLNGVSGRHYESTYGYYGDDSEQMDSADGNGRT